MLVGILIAVTVLFAVLLVVIAMQPPTFRVVRSATVSAPQAVAFEQVNELRRWEEWSPWAKIDPNCKMTYEGPPAGAGAKYGWSGNKKVGEGRMTITESRPNDLVRLNLDFIPPFRANHTVEFTFEPKGDQTLVTWSMFGAKNFMSKGFGLFVDMDKMIGADFEKGLAQMKALCETSVPA